LFALCFLVLTPLPRILAFEIPVLARVPLGILVEVTVPAFAGTLALVAATLVLSRHQEPSVPTVGLGPRFRERLKPSLAAALLSALLATILLFVPYIGLLLSFLLMPLILGPPIIGQVVAVEGLSIRDAKERARALTEGIRGRVLLYLLNVGLGLGIATVLLVGGAMTLVTSANDLTRVLINSIYQAAILGAIVGFLAAVEYVVFVELVARAKTAVAIPD